MQLLPLGKQQFTDSTGAPLAGGSVYFYAIGTTTFVPTWADQAGTVTNPNPVVLDSGGKATIWGSHAYRQVVKDAAGSTVWDENIDASVSQTDLGLPSAASTIGYMPSGSASPQPWNVQGKLREWRSVLDFMTDEERADVLSGTLAYNHTDAFERALSSGEPILIPPITANVEHLTLRNGVSIWSQNAVLRDIAHSEYTEMVALDAGPVISVSIVGRLRFEGNECNPTKRGWYLDGRPAGGGNNGGIWWSDFNGIYITGFSGAALYIRGSDDTAPADCPMQFLSFRNLVAYGGKCEDTVILEGKVGQCYFEIPQLEGYAQTTRPLKLMRRIKDDGTQGDTAPYAITFQTPTFQTGSEVRIERATRIVMNSIYSENMKSGIVYDASWDRCEINGGTFSNVHNDGAGFCIQTGAASPGSTGRLTIRNVSASGTFDRGIVGSSSADIQLSGVIAMPSTGVTIQQNVAATHLIKAYGRRTMIVEASDYIDQIIGGNGAGSELFVMSFNGDNTYVTGATGANQIYVPGGTKTFPRGATAHFVKFDLAGVWQLVN